jgi:hypothetical protein
LLGLLLAGAEVLESHAVQQLGEAHIEGFEQVARNVEVEIPYCVGASSEYQSGQPLSQLGVLAGAQRALRHPGQRAGLRFRSVRR